MSGSMLNTGSLPGPHRSGWEAVLRKFLGDSTENQLRYRLYCSTKKLVSPYFIDRSCRLEAFSAHYVNKLMFVIRAEVSMDLPLVSMRTFTSSSVARSWLIT